MKKEHRNILILIIILLAVVFFSYFIFSSGITNKIKASVQGMSAGIDNNINASELPVINEVINSSGEELVNTDVALIINASSKYNINKLEYSYDLKNWIEYKNEINGKEISVKLAFSKTQNTKFYIRVKNDHGYRSYAYETIVNIDKEIPTLEFKSNKSMIYAKDNVELSSIQYSNDKLNWDTKEITGEELTLNTDNLYYKYIRVVDKAGNISEIKDVK